MREIGEKGKDVPLGVFTSFDNAKAFEEEIKFDCWATYILQKRLDA